MRKDDQSEKFISDEILKENWLFDIGKKIFCASLTTEIKQ